MVEPTPLSSKARGSRETLTRTNLTDTIPQLFFAQCGLTYDNEIGAGLLISLGEGNNQEVHAHFEDIHGCIYEVVNEILAARHPNISPDQSVLSSQYTEIATALNELKKLLPEATLSDQTADTVKQNLQYALSQASQKLTGNSSAFSLPIEAVRTR